MTEQKYFCNKCQKMMAPVNFYTYKNGDKTELCKKCLTLHLDPYEPDTFLWIMEKLDIPYIPTEWAKIIERDLAKKPESFNGTAVFGKYLSKMKLKQWNWAGWDDTEKIQADIEKQKTLAERGVEMMDLKEQLENGEITEAEYMTLSPISLETPSYTSPPPSSANILPPVSVFSELPEGYIDPAADLTNEDKVYLATKWGQMYKPSEWMQLEKNYDDMMRSFDIRDADTENSLILLCKTNLKANQAIDLGDLDGYQKLSKVAESLRKTAKFTAAQNKDKANEGFDSIGELIVMCEKEGFIPRYATDIPQDKVDQTLLDMNNYLRKLVTQDLGFGQQIEDSIKKIQLQREMNEEESRRQANGDDSFEALELEDEDHEVFYEEIMEQRERDMETIFGKDE